jgi:L-ascorbate metabolism protein UlaG (beta-lactamase superfamily)
LKRWLLLSGLVVACAHRQNVDEPDPNALIIHGQKVPEYAVPANPADFTAAPDTAVMHYYGSGGWLIQWHGTTVLAAPYFSNHGIASLLASDAVKSKILPKAMEVRAGVQGTPIEKTNIILIGHGHVDHSGDVPALFDQGLIGGKPVLMADRSTTNQLNALASRFSCIAPVDYTDMDTASGLCPVPNVRVTPVLNAHAPHLNLIGLDVAAFGGHVKEPQRDPPSTAADYKLGTTWAYLIDLLDEKGKVAFRIHYVDAVGTPPHGIVPAALLKEHDVDLHIACVPGFEQADFYPDAVLSYHHVKYVLLGHWEDFFQPQTEPLRPLRQVLNGPAIERFVDIVEKQLPHAQGVVPVKPTVVHGEAWSLPVPGETLQFVVGH